MILRKLVIVAIMLGCFSSLAYKMEAGEYYVGGGFGMNANVAHFDNPPRVTPAVQLPIIMNIDYIIDRNFGAFGSIVPMFSSGSVAFLFRGGAKYWFMGLDAPLVPYASLALTPSFLIPSGPAHFNIGISPGIGANYFILANFLVGAHLNVNPSIAFAGGEKKFEFAVMTYFDVSMRL